MGAMGSNGYCPVMRCRLEMAGRDGCKPIHIVEAFVLPAAIHVDGANGYAQIAMRRIRDQAVEMARLNGCAVSGATQYSSHWTLGS